MKTKTFEVRWTVVADRPELRNASYAPVAAGTKVHQRQVTTSQTQAIRLFEELLGGEWDFAAEYVAAAAVSQLYTGRSPRTVRRRVERERAETTRQRQRAILQVGAARRGALWLAFFHVDCCPVAPALTDRRETDAQRFDDAYGLAFEVVDAYGSAGADRFATDHAGAEIALRALEEALIDHGMARAA